MVYLPEGVGSAMVEHETQDYSDEYRMDELRLAEVLKEIGFSDIIITDRVEREVVLIAEK